MVGLFGWGAKELIQVCYPKTEFLFFSLFGLIDFFEGRISSQLLRHFLFAPHSTSASIFPNHSVHQQVKDMALEQPLVLWQCADNTWKHQYFLDEAKASAFFLQNQPGTFRVLWSSGKIQLTHPSPAPPPGFEKALNSALRDEEPKPTLLWGHHRSDSVSVSLAVTGPGTNTLDEKGARVLFRGVLPSLIGRYHGSIDGESVRVNQFGWYEFYEAHLSWEHASTQGAIKCPTHKTHPFDPRNDLYSLAALVVDLVAPTPADPIVEVPFVGRYNSPVELSPEFRDLLNWCLNQDIDRRPASAKEALWAFRALPPLAEEQLTAYKWESIASRMTDRKRHSPYGEDVVQVNGTLFTTEQCVAEAQRMKELEKQGKAGKP